MLEMDGWNGYETKVLNETDGWEVAEDDETLIIRGPGDLEIRIDFSPARLQVSEPEPTPDPFSDNVKKRQWNYRLDGGLVLHLGSVWGDDGRPEFHRLSVGENIEWFIPASLAEFLYGLPTELH